MLRTLFALGNENQHEEKLYISKGTHLSRGKSPWYWKNVIFIRINGKRTTVQQYSWENSNHIHNFFNTSHEKRCKVVHRFLCRFAFLPFSWPFTSLPRFTWVPLASTWPPWQPSNLFLSTCWKPRNPMQCLGNFSNIALWFWIEERWKAQLAVIKGILYRICKFYLLFMIHRNRPYPHSSHAAKTKSGRLVFCVPITLQAPRAQNFRTICLTWQGWSAGPKRIRMQMRLSMFFT